MMDASNRKREASKEKKAINVKKRLEYGLRLIPKESLYEWLSWVLTFFCDTTQSIKTRRFISNQAIGLAEPQRISYAY